MQNEAAYEAAVWRWFFGKAKRRAGHYGLFDWVDLSDREANHLETCGIRKGSSIPELGSVTEFVSTFQGTQEVLAIQTDNWICNCGEYGGHHTVALPGNPRGPIQWENPRHVLSGLGIDGRVALEEVIMGVIEAAKEEAGET